jgi:hypothetical protein
VAAFELGGVDRPLTPVEEAFVDAVVGDEPPLLDVWRHVDADGSPWLLISCDFVLDGAVRDTLRLDFDGTVARGGWSQFFLNGDDGVRAESAGVDFDGPDGLAIDEASLPDAAYQARRWFERHYLAWPNSSRGKRWA